MAVKTQRGSALPEGAVKLSQGEALEIQRNFVNNWPSKLEVFSLKYAPHLCGASTAITSTIAFSFFRKLFNVPNVQSIVSYGPVVIIPTVMSCLTANKILTDKSLLMKTSCPLCTQLKFTTVQLYNSVLSPIVFSYLFCHYYGNHPKAFESAGPPFQTKDFWKDVLKQTEKGFPRFKFIAIFQLCFSFLLPYFQSTQLLNISEKFEQSTYNEELNDDILM